MNTTGKCDTKNKTKYPCKVSEGVSNKVYQTLQEVAHEVKLHGKLTLLDQPTELGNEVFLELHKSGFFSKNMFPMDELKLRRILGSRVIRQIYAYRRRKKQAKHGGQIEKCSLDEKFDQIKDFKIGEDNLTMLQLAEGMESLKHSNPEAYSVAEKRIFLDMKISEIQKETKAPQGKTYRIWYSAAEHLRSFVDSEG